MEWNRRTQCALAQSLEHLELKWVSKIIGKHGLLNNVGVVVGNFGIIEIYIIRKSVDLSRIGKIMDLGHVLYA